MVSCGLIVGSTSVMFAGEALGVGVGLMGVGLVVGCVGLGVMVGVGGACLFSFMPFIKSLFGPTPAGAGVSAPMLLAVMETIFAIHDAPLTPGSTNRSPSDSGLPSS